VRARLVALFGEPMSAQKTVSHMTLEEVRDELLRTTRVYLDLLTEKERELTGAPSAHVVSKTESIADPRYIRLPLSDAVVAVLDSCNEPQAAKSIATILKRAGREFDSDDPVHSVRSAIKKAMTANPDVIHIGSAKYHLRSKYRGKARKLEKLMAKANGTGGQTVKEHGRRTSVGIAKRRSEGHASWGPAKKVTAELLDKVREMLRSGAKVKDVCKTLNVSTASLYGHGIKPTELKKEGRKQRELALDHNTESGNVVHFAKAQNE
jgi:hypothetical protein